MSAAVVAVALLATGCRSPLALGDGRDDPSIDGIQGPTERRLKGQAIEQAKSERLSRERDGSLEPLEGYEEFAAAEKLFEDGKLEEAEKEFKRIAKKYRVSSWNWASLAFWREKKEDAFAVSHTPNVREDALFMLGETQFALQRYARAHDSYTELVTEYPATRYLDDISRRLFKIAQIWLEDPTIEVSTSEIQQVSLERPGKLIAAEKPNEAPRFTAVPNITDRSRPVFDTPGNALAALKSIWMNDPAGPLADDALMMAAGYYARTGKFLDADYHYTMLREQYPNSPHAQNAYLIGSHVKLMSYQGERYDGTKLEDSQTLKQTMLRLYPQLESRQMLSEELAAMEEARAAREYAVAEFYFRKKKYAAVAIYTNLLMQEYPDSIHARKSRELLKQIPPQYRTGAWISPSPEKPADPPAKGADPAPKLIKPDPEGRSIVKPADGPVAAPESTGRARL